MKILFVHNRYRHEGGEEQAIANLERLLTEKGHQTHRFECSSRDWSGQSVWQKMWSASQTVYSFRTVRAFARALDDFRPEVVHVHNVFPLLSPSIYSTARRKGVPIVQTIHNYRLMCVNGLFLTPEGAICERCKFGSFWSSIRFGCYGNSRIRTLPMAGSLAFHRAAKTFERCIDAYIAPTQFVRSKLVEARFPEDRIVVLPHPIFPPQIREDRSERPLFLYVGRLSKEKGSWTLLRAFLDSSLGDLKIIGDGPLRNELEQFAKEHSLRHVEFLGTMDSADVFRWMSRAWALIVPSECYETFGQVILEAWSCGTPVIASRIGVFPELIQEGQTGWLFKAGDAADLKQSVHRVSQNGAFNEELRARCHRHFVDHYNREGLYPRFLEVYRRILRN